MPARPDSLWAVTCLVQHRDWIHVREFALSYAFIVLSVFTACHYTPTLLDHLDPRNNHVHQNILYRDLPLYQAMHCSLTDTDHGRTGDQNRLKHTEIRPRQETNLPRLAHFNDKDHRVHDMLHINCRICCHLHCIQT